MSGMISVSLVELDALKERWETRLANQKQVIDNLQAALDAERRSSASWEQEARLAITKRDYWRTRALTAEGTES